MGGKVDRLDRQRDGRVYRLMGERVYGQAVDRQPGEQTYHTGRLTGV